MVNHVMAIIVIHVRVNNVELVLQMHAQPEDAHELLRKLLEYLQIISEEMAEYINSSSWNRPTFYDDDDGHSIQYKEYLENSSNAIAPVFPTKEPEYSLICDDFTTFSNPIFDFDDDFTSNDDESLFDEDVPIENFRIYSNSVFDDEEIISSKKDPHHFVESDLIESLLNQDTLIDSSSKFDFLLEEFSGKLAHIDPILQRIEEVDFDLEEEICLVENLLYENSSLRLPDELKSEIADTILEFLSSSPIPVEDSDSQMEEIDLFLDTDDLMPPSIENDDYDSEGDIHILEEFLSNDSLLIPENNSSNFDHHDDLSFPRPPPKPPDVEVAFDFEPDTGVLTTKVVADISKHYVLMPKVLPTQPTLCPNINPLHLFLFENEDKVFKAGVLSYLLVSHRDKTISDFLKTR
nr:hypothetical protein [Tanacetum cinerariifolium]